MDEQSYLLGQQALARRIVSQLKDCLESGTEASLQLELSETRAVLARILEALDCYDEFDAGLHLADLAVRIEKIIASRE